MSRPPFSNLDKVLWPQAGLTKLDYLRYLETVAPAMLPYLRGRPLLLRRCPDGTAGQCFFWRERPAWAPPWVPAVPVPRRRPAAREGAGETHAGGSPDERTLMTCEDLATLLWLGNLACVEIHAWSARTPHLHLADQLVLDLDPVEGMGGAEPALLREAAGEVRALLDALGLPSWLKASGSRGFHVHVPLERPVEHERAVSIARDLAAAARRRRPDLFCLERSPGRRRRPVYLDYLQNGYQKTIVAPYSPRADRVAAVACPIAWDDLPAAAPAATTIRDLLSAGTGGRAGGKTTNGGRWTPSGNRG